MSPEVDRLGLARANSSGGVIQLARGLGIGGVSMNSWSESIRLAGLLLRRLREFNERGVRAFFTRDCRRFDSSNWRFDERAIKCLRTWYIRALVSVASVLHPLVKAYGVSTWSLLSRRSM
ncbi:hypothetical protein [Vulcanisaeta distributa]|uniref:hypothetical protein n=1 Tax=Vulcanisaeta distributa TaxID=164451 RepID=UPI000ACEDD66|nr:hypothetical protein [Vulcanisaeta distributa]